MYTTHTPERRVAACDAEAMQAPVLPESRGGLSPGLLVGDQSLPPGVASKRMHIRLSGTCHSSILSTWIHLFW
jgi:hypothetical protein